jgi:hypothetical protein
MKRYVVLFLCFICFFSSPVFAKKYEKAIETKLNPAVDLSKLDFSTVTIFMFDKNALCGDDMLALMHTSLSDYLKSNNVGSILVSPDKMKIENNEFSLSSTGIDSKSSLFQTASSDIVISGTLDKFDVMTKKWAKVIIDTSFTVFIYSKSLNTVVYKATFSYMNSDAGHRGKSFLVFFGDTLDPFFTKLKESKK